MKSEIKDNLLIIKEDNGNEKEYEIIAKISSEENKKEYIVFTDNELDEDGCIMTYAYVLNKGTRDNNLYPIETDEEYEFLEKLLANLDSKMNEE